MLPQLSRQNAWIFPPFPWPWACHDHRAMRQTSRLQNCEAKESRDASVSTLPQCQPSSVQGRHPPTRPPTESAHAYVCTLRVYSAGPRMHPARGSSREPLTDPQPLDASLQVRNNEILPGAALAAPAAAPAAATFTVAPASTLIATAASSSSSPASYHPTFTASSMPQLPGPAPALQAKRQKTRAGSESKQGKWECMCRTEEQLRRGVAGGTRVQCVSECPRERWARDPGWPFAPTIPNVPAVGARCSYLPSSGKTGTIEWSGGREGWKPV